VQYDAQISKKTRELRHPPWTASISALMTVIRKVAALSEALV